MSRRAHFASWGRTPSLPSPGRLTRSAMAHLDEIDNIPTAHQRPQRNFVPHEKQGRARLARANRTQRKTADSSTENESSDDEIADDENDEASDEDEDGDDESDQPAAFAPPRGHNKQTIPKAGQLAEYRRMLHSEDPVLYEDPYELFGGSPEDDDEDFYRAVDDISDEDEQNDESFQLNGTNATAATGLLLEQSHSPFFLPNPEHEADSIVDRVDGLSAYGFGGDLDTADGSGEMSPPSENSDVPAVSERRVHFVLDIEHMNAHGKSVSPSLTRALLPSAKSLGEENHIGALNNAYQNPKNDAPVAVEDVYDSDATEVNSRPLTPSQRSDSIANLAPIESGIQTSGIGKNDIAKTQHRKRSYRRRRGPPRGIFTVDQDKSWAILDSTGKKILQIPAANTNRHAWLDEMSYSTATPTSESPLNPIPQLYTQPHSTSIDQAASSRLVVNTAVPDVTTSGFDGRTSVAESDHGRTIGPLEAFYSKDLQLVGGDYAVSPEPESEACDEEVTPITKKSGFPLAEFLEDLGDDDSEDIDSTLPLFAPADENLTGDDDGIFSHVSNINVTAFRRSADPMSALRPGITDSYDMLASPIAGSSLALPVSAPIATTSHKRKASSTPYQDEKIYGDVTPVERKVIHVSKRRKLAT